MDANKCPPYKETECRNCKDKEHPLFLIPNPRDAKDFFCEVCKIQEIKKRAEEVKNGIKNI